MPSLQDPNLPLARGWHFWKWLWGDWGQPNAFTTVGIPRLIVDLLGYLLAPYVLYAVTMRWISGNEQDAFRRLVSNPFILSAYGVFYLTRISHEYLEAGLKGSGVDEHCKSWHNYKDPVVTLFWATLSCATVLFLIGAVQFRASLK
jgi:hypothetical protein